MTQWGAWGGGASKEVVLEEDREDDTGEFFYVSWASVAERRRVPLIFDRCGRQKSGKWQRQKPSIQGASTGELPGLERG